MFGFEICFPVQRKKKLRGEITLVFIRVEEIDQLSFFSSFSFSLSLLSSSSLLIFFPFSCFPTMPFPQTFFATFFPTLLVTVGLLPRRKSFASSSILLHFFSSLLVTRKFFPQTLECIFVFQFVAIHVKSRPAYNAKLSPSFKSYYIPSSIFFYKSETFSLYIATFIFTSLYDCEAFILT